VGLDKHRHLHNRHRAGQTVQIRVVPPLEPPFCRRFAGTEASHPFTTGFIRSAPLGRLRMSATRRVVPKRWLPRSVARMRLFAGGFDLGRRQLACPTGPRKTGLSSHDTLARIASGLASIIVLAAQEGGDLQDVHCFGGQMAPLAFGVKHPSEPARRWDLPQTAKHAMTFVRCQGPRAAQRGPGPCH